MVKTNFSASSPKRSRMMISDHLIKIRKKLEDDEPEELAI